jgi:hypothetical protein
MDYELAKSLMDAGFPQIGLEAQWGAPWPQIRESGCLV